MNDQPEDDGSGSRTPAIAGLAIAVVLLFMTALVVIPYLRWTQRHEGVSR